MHPVNYIHFGLAPLRSLVTSVLFSLRKVDYKVFVKIYKTCERKNCNLSGKTGDVLLYQMVNDTSLQATGLYYYTLESLC